MVAGPYEFRWMFPRKLTKLKLKLNPSYKPEKPAALQAKSRRRNWRFQRGKKNHQEMQSRGVSKWKFISTHRGTGRDGQSARGSERGDPESGTGRYMVWVLLYQGVAGWTNPLKWWEYCQSNGDTRELELELGRGCRGSARLHGMILSYWYVHIYCACSTDGLLQPQCTVKTHRRPCAVPWT